MQGTDNTSSDNKAILSYNEQLRYNSSDLKVVLYSKDRAYEYSQYTHRFRPFNSVLWYPFKDSIFDDFIFYLDDKIKCIKECFDNHKDWKDIFVSSSIEGSRIEIDLENIAFEVILNSKNDIYYSFAKFFNFISSVYDLNESILKKIIDFQINIL